MISPYACLLVFHGSRDYRTQSAAHRLKELLATNCQFKNILTQQNYSKKNLLAPPPEVVSTLDFPQTHLVDVAALELASKPLNESLVDFAQKAEQKGFKQIKVIPLFLVPGVHVREDIPAEIALAIKQINNRVTIKLSPCLGKFSGIVPLLTSKFLQLSAETRILIAHGSRLSGVNHYYQNLASQLNATMAYWSVSPSLVSQIKAQIASGKKQIAILPYFLFPGKITSAIAQEVKDLQTQHPQVELILGQPLGATAALAELIAKEA
ncbi:sirohydrochlorin chelatase [Pleurocapsales cyanobacterium LEGE 10410]|nr:sirohydrochlorin chelatase [Pleurocapsales cyanobacterium LEGE 10410]